MPGAEATVEGPARRRVSWSLKTLVEEAAGRPIGDLVDPDRPLHPYLRVKMGGTTPVAVARSSYLLHRSAPPEETEAEEIDPVDRVHPPLTGAVGRELHGPHREHHAAILASIEAGRAAANPAGTPTPPGPSRRPERVYLHYLLLHLDRLNDSALRYLGLAVSEELAHREHPPPLPTPAEEVPTPPPAA